MQLLYTKPYQNKTRSFTKNDQQFRKKDKKEYKFRNKIKH